MDWTLLFIGSLVLLAIVSLLGFTGCSSLAEADDWPPDKKDPEPEPEPEVVYDDLVTLGEDGSASLVGYLASGRSIGDSGRRQVEQRQSRNIRTRERLAPSRPAGYRGQHHEYLLRWWFVQLKFLTIPLRPSGPSAPRHGSGLTGRRKNKSGTRCWTHRVRWPGRICVAT